MRLFKLIRQMIKGETPEADVLDHVPVSGSADWRAAKLAEAAKRYGRPFKCAADGVPREVQIGTADAHMIIIKGQQA